MRNWLVALVVALLLLAVRCTTVGTGLWVDLDVYVAGARAFLEGDALYDLRVAGLPFTYPPFASVALVPLTWVPVTVARVLMTVASVSALVGVLWVVARRCALPSLPVVVVGVAALGSEPVVRNLILGQVNLLLVLLVVVDLLVLPQRWRGVLVGVATGIKLVPGAFALLFVLRRDWQSLGRAGVALGVTVLVGFARPDSSWSFWSGGLWSLGVGDTVVRADNQSWAGIAMRLAGTAELPGLFQAGLTAAALALGLWCASRMEQHPLRDTLQLHVMAIAALMASPVSWTHHWVWMAPITVVLVHLRAWLVVAVAAPAFWLGVVWIAAPPPAGGAWGVGAQLLASTYVVVGLATMAVLTRAGASAQDDGRRKADDARRTGPARAGSG